MDGSAIETAEAVIFLTKTYDTRDAASAVRAAVAPSTCVVTLHNGLNNDRVLAEVSAPIYRAIGQMVKMLDEMHLEGTGSQ